MKKRTFKDFLNYDGHEEGSKCVCNNPVCPSILKKEIMVWYEHFTNERKKDGESKYQYQAMGAQRFIRTFFNLNAKDIRLMKESSREVKE